MRHIRLRRSSLILSFLKHFVALYLMVQGLVVATFVYYVLLCNMLIIKEWVVSVSFKIPLLASNM